jgi:hypothetical protein
MQTAGHSCRARHDIEPLICSSLFNAAPWPQRKLSLIEHESVKADRAGVSARPD